MKYHEQLCEENRKHTNKSHGRKTAVLADNHGSKGLAVYAILGFFFRVFRRQTKNYSKLYNNI